MQQIIIQILLVSKLVFSNMLLIQTLWLLCGNRATNASSSNFFLQAGNGATDARDSNFMGFNAGLQQHMHLIQISLVRVLVNQQHMHLIQIFGQQAGASTFASNSNFFGITLVMKQQMLLVQISWVIKLVLEQECSASNFIMRWLFSNWCISIKFHWFSWL
jgi:hypothetical protein